MAGFIRKMLAGGLWLAMAACAGNNSDSGAATSSADASGGSAATAAGTEAAMITDWYQPALMASWQWQLMGELNTTYAVELYDVDLVDTPPSLIASLQSSGHKVICYFSAGSWENYRDDATQFDTAVLGNTLDGWPDERWLDIRSAEVRALMQARLDLAVSKGCDGVEPDNVDGYSNDSGFVLTAADQLDYNRFLANQAHQRGLSVGLKNDLDQVAALEEHFDFAVNEQCFEYEECGLLDPFIAAGKPVLNAEYRADYATHAETREALCSQSLSLQFSTLVLPLDLDDSYRFSCL